MKTEKDVSYRRTIGLITSVVIAAILGLWWLSELLPYRGWAMYQADSESWSVVSTGWYLLIEVWPIVLIGGALGVVIGVLVAGYLVEQTVQADLADRFDEVQQQVEKVRSGSEILAGKEAEVLRRCRAKEARLAEQAIELDRQFKQVKRFQQQAEQQIQAMQEQVADADRRRRNAAATAERRKRKLDKIKSDLGLDMS